MIKTIIKRDERLENAFEHLFAESKRTSDYRDVVHENRELIQKQADDLIDVHNKLFEEVKRHIATKRELVIANLRNPCDNIRNQNNKLLKVCKQRDSDIAELKLQLRDQKKVADDRLKFETAELRAELKRLRRGAKKQRQKKIDDRKNEHVSRNKIRGQNNKEIGFVCF